MLPLKSQCPVWGAAEGVEAHVVAVLPPLCPGVEGMQTGSQVLPHGEAGTT